MDEPGGIRFGGIIKMGVLFSALLLAYLSFSTLKLLSDTREYLERDMEKRLLDLAEAVSPELQKEYDEALHDPYDLYAIALKESLIRFTLLDRSGRPIANSAGSTLMDKPLEAPGITPEQMAGVWGGKPRVSSSYTSGKRTVRSVYFPVKDGSGNIAAVAEATVDAGYIEDLTELGTTYFFLKSLIIVFLAVVLVYVLRTYFMSQRRLMQAASGAGMVDYGTHPAGDNTSFMVNAFHTMVSTLKEKELELKQLKERAEEKARYIESYNENVLMSINSGVITFDMGGRVVTANQASERILGLSEGSAPGMVVDELFKDGWTGALIRKTLEKGLPERRGEGMVKTLGGESRWLGAGTSPLHGPGGDITGAILVFTDLTEVKELKDRMELKERMTVLGEMSAGIAHELRNPMAVISGYAKLLAKNAGGDNASRDAVESIQAEITVMDEIIREFMNFTQPTELNIVKVDIKPLLEESLKALSGLGEGVKRELTAPDGLPQFEGDAVLLRQAFINIMKNAIESMDDGGKLAVSAGLVAAGEQDDVRLPGPSYIKVEVTDTGYGVTGENLRKIFTPFFTTKSHGTGLGLALVQKILVYHGGRATVKSREGQGTTFSVYLPVSAHERT